MPTTPYMKKMRPMRIATHGKAWKDLMKVQSRVRIPSPLLRSFTSLMTRNRRKKLMEIMFPPGWKYMKKILEYIFHQKITVVLYGKSGLTLVQGSKGLCCLTEFTYCIQAIANSVMLISKDCRKIICSSTLYETHFILLEFLWKIHPIQ